MLLDVGLHRKGAFGHGFLSISEFGLVARWYNSNLAVRRLPAPNRHSFFNRYETNVL